MRNAWVLLAAVAAFSRGAAHAPAFPFTDGDPEVQARVNRALVWLAAQQQGNGSWTCKVGYKLYETYNGQEAEHVGVTALACMAFVGAGHVPGRGGHGEVVERGLKYVLDHVREEDGYVTSNGTRMYSHAFSTMFLAEIYGMDPRDDIKGKLKRAVALLVGAQNREGGWRYSPTPVDADLSVTVSCLQALRGARNAGVSVPLDTIDRATRYVRRCYTRRGFAYQPANEYAMNDSRITYPLTACGIVSLYSAGLYGADEVQQGVLALESRSAELHWGRYHYLYGHYYAAQANFVAGEDHWQSYYERVKREILEHQWEDGGWSDDVGRTYATAMACIVLQMPNELLPIFQR